MTAQWKPGDVGFAESIGPVFRYINEDGIANWITPTMGRYYGKDVRPLVVIDAEDREQVERLTTEIQWLHGESDVDRVQAALRSLIAPSKPEEPTGRYAVVEDEAANEWVRADLVGTAQWSLVGTSKWASYDDINVARVIHPGVVA